MSQIEFQVTTDLTPITGAVIETNFEAVRDWLTEELAPYATMVVSPDSIAEAKKTRANIRKVGESIDSQRKAIKKLWNKPYEDYENKCKELTGIVNDAVSNIDGQIKEMENEVKEAKRQRLESLFIEKSADVSDYISFDDIFDSKWLNSTFSEIDAANIIVAKIEDTIESLDFIRSMSSVHEAAMLSEFAKSHSLPKALQEGKRLDAIQKAEEERKARESVQETQDVEETFDDDCPPETLHVFVPSPSPVRPVTGEPKPKLYTLQFEVTMTREQSFALKDFFTKAGIKYKKI